MKNECSYTSTHPLYAFVLWATAKLYLCLLLLSITRYFMHAPLTPKNKERTNLPLHISPTSQRLRPINDAVL